MKISSVVTQDDQKTKTVACECAGMSLVFSYFSFFLFQSTVHFPLTVSSTERVVNLSYEVRGRQLWIMRLVIQRNVEHTTVVGIVY